MSVGIRPCQQNFDQEPAWFPASLLGSVAACLVGCCGAGPLAFQALGSSTGWQETCQGLGRGGPEVYGEVYLLILEYYESVTSRWKT